MRRSHQRLLVLLLIVLPACAAPTGAEPTILTGAWASVPEAFGPSGSVQSHLYFSADGHFSAQTAFLEHRLGPASTEVSSTVTVRGRFREEGDRIVFRPEVLITWEPDATGPLPVVQAPYPYDRFYEDAHYEVSDGGLTLSYLTYPADAPVRTEQMYHRLGPD